MRELEAATKKLKQGTFFRSDKKLLSDLRFCLFSGSRIWYAINDSGDTCSVIAGRMLKRPTGDWGRYFNWQVSFTRPAERGMGYGWRLLQHARAVAISEGCVRIKTKAGTTSSIGLHKKVKDQFWGVNANGDLVADSPLIPMIFPEGTPPSVLKEGIRSTEPLSEEGLDRILLTTVLSYDRLDIK